MDTVVVMPHYVEATITIRQILSYESVARKRSLDEMGHRRYGASQIDMRLNGNTSHRSDIARTSPDAISVISASA